MNAHLTDSHDRAMTTEAAHGAANHARPAGTRISPRSRSFANSSAPRQSGDIELHSANSRRVNHRWKALTTGSGYLRAQVRIPAARFRPSLCIEHAPRKQEGAGKAGCRLHPQPRVRNKKAHEHRHYRFTGLTRPSLRDGLRLISCSPRCAGLVSHRRRRNCFRQLDTSVGVSGPHDFASPHCHRSPCDTNASTASCTNVRGERACAPLGGTGRLDSVPLICPTAQVNIFLQKGWTGDSLICPSGKSVAQIMRKIFNAQDFCRGTPYA